MPKRMVPDFPLSTKRRAWLRTIPPTEQARLLTEALKRARRSLRELGFERIHTLQYKHGSTHPLNFLAIKEDPLAVDECMTLICKASHGRVLVLPLQQPSFAFQGGVRQRLKEDLGDLARLLVIVDEPFNDPGKNRMYRWQQLVLKAELSPSDAAMARS